MRFHAMHTTIAIGGLALLCGCASTLEPAKTATPVEGEPRAARASRDGIQLTAKSGWPGKVQIQSAVTPLLVTLENDSGAAIQVSYDDFQIWGPDNQAFRALPIGAIQGEVDATAGADNPVPEKTTKRFSIAPGFESPEPGTELYDEDFEHDGYAAHNNELYRVKLPTESMFRGALPEGTLEDGGMVEGYLYFEHVGSDVEKATLRAQFARDTTNAVALEIPFTVVDGPATGG